MASPVIVVAYDPAWPATFEDLRAKLAAALGDAAIAIEHVGSTAVPGLAAKPIIDIDVISAPSDLPTVIERLAGIGYVHRGDLGIAGREAFDRPQGAVPHHLYVCAPDAAELHRHLNFRDKLRADPAAAKAYGDLKMRLAEQFRDDRLAYNDGKTEWVLALLAR